MPAKLTTFGRLTLQRIRENVWITHSALLLLAICGFGLAMARRRRAAVVLLSQVHRSARRVWLRRLVEPYVLNNLAAFQSAAASAARADIPSIRRRLLVLKPPLSGGEKGVLLVMFTEMLDFVHSSMDVPRLLKDYTLVFEPSYPGYCNSSLLQYARFADDIFVLSPVPDDFEFLQHTHSNLIPVCLGPCDWVDPAIAEPYLTTSKDFDVVMNAIWAALKRHYVLFQMLAHAKRRYRVALIGVNWAGRERADVEREAKYYGVLDQLSFFDSISYPEVMNVTCRSEVSLLLSLKEAGPRAIAESMFCDVPVIVLSDLIGGIVKNVVPETGLRTSENDLEGAIELLRRRSIHPRAWALQNISCLKSTERLNSILRDRALAQNRPWSQGIAVRANSPECKYVLAADAERLRSYNQALSDYIL
jgi:glycosyltransferase involved in cell wall biosynthesis